MKTLDEVIKALESARIQVETGYGLWVDYRDNDDLKADALHYLKLLKTHCDRVQNQIEDLREEYRPNDPLTWDELRQMEGKPVWIDGSVCSSGFWAIVEGFGESGGADYVFLCGNQFWKEDMKDDDNGLSWNAFRKERE